MFPSLSAAAAEEITDSESDSEVDTKKKRYRREKIGFRDRKVNYFSIHFKNQDHSCLN